MENNFIFLASNFKFHQGYGKVLLMPSDSLMVIVKSKYFVKPLYDNKNFHVETMNSEKVTTELRKEKMFPHCIIIAVNYRDLTPNKDTFCYNIRINSD